MARLASSILNVLWPNPWAPLTSVSATRWKVAREAGWPRNDASARRVAPRFVGHTTERESGLLDCLPVHPQGGRYGHQREDVGGAVANLEVSIVVGETLGRQVDGCDDLVGPLVRVEVRRVAREAVKVAEGDRPGAARSGAVHHRCQRRERHAHVRRMDDDAVLAGAQDRVITIESGDRWAASP